MQVTWSQDGARSCLLGSVPEETPRRGLLIGGQVVRSPASSLRCPGADAAHPETVVHPTARAAQSCCAQASEPRTQSSTPRDCGARSGGRFLRIPRQPGLEAGLLWRGKVGSFLAVLGRVEQPRSTRTSYSRAGSFMKYDPGRWGLSGWGPRVVLGAGQGWDEAGGEHRG